MSIDLDEACERAERRQILTARHGEALLDALKKARAELALFREREPLVQTLLACCDGICNSDKDARQAVVAVLYARDDVRAFKVKP